MIDRRDRNGGFSLVELVITVLIMAIVAAALAPQVTKWVNNARIANDLQTRSSLESYARYAMADPTAYEEVASRQIKITADETGCVLSDTDTGSTEAFPFFAKAFAEYAGFNISPDGNGYKMSALKLRTPGAEITVFVTRGAVSSIINQALTSDDLEVAASDVVVPELWNSLSLTGSDAGTVDFTNSAGSVINPAVALRREHTFENGYLDNILVIESTSDITTVKTDGVVPPAWVYVGPTSEIAVGNYSNVSLYQWSGTRDGANNPVWKRLPITGLR